MLGRFEILVGIGGPMVIGLIFEVIVRKKRQKGYLPPGSIVVEGPEPEKRGMPPSTPWVRRASTIGISFVSFFSFWALIVSIFDWLSTPAILIFDLPPWVNWGGMVALWFEVIWGLSVLFYNVNYTALFLGMKGKYVMASGGPYKYLRHPAYVGKAIETLCIFLITGLLPVLLAVPFWGALPKQAAGEEAVMRELFGRQYEDYMQRTGQFFPKFHRLKS